ncbi:MAG: M15 family peptidase [Actinomycetales bacterium]|nr:M15 family peptidase [Actinomycetales bacterium]
MAAGQGTAGPEHRAGPVRDGGGPPAAVSTTTATPGGSGTATRPGATTTTGRVPGTREFRWEVRRVTARELGRSWRDGCPVGPEDLRAVTLTHWGFDGRVRTGTLVLHRDVVPAARRVFARMFDRRFPVRRIRPVTAYGADDDASMADDNTSAFNCRFVAGSASRVWSRHAYGRAVDVNPVENPYVLDDRVLPPAGRAFLDRSVSRPGMIRRGDAVHRAFVEAGFRWGGDFGAPDYQHFDRR